MARPLAARSGVTAAIKTAYSLEYSSLEAALTVPLSAAAAAVYYLLGRRQDFLRG